MWRSLAVFGVTLVCAAADNPPKTYDCPKTTAVLTIDGRLNDAAWRQAVDGSFRRYRRIGQAAAKASNASQNALG